MPRRILPFLAALACLAGLLPLAAIVPAGQPETPWPAGAEPAPQVLSDLVGDALRVADRETGEEFLDAYDKGEDREEVTISQADIDRRLFDHDRLFRAGDAFFSHEFRAEDGYGDSAFTTLRRVHTSVRGGLDTFSCAGCHSVGGLDGAGSETENALVGGDGERASSANVRNAPAMLGLGLVQALAVEMTAELGAERNQAVERAVAGHAPAVAALSAKGVAFGAITAGADGQVDTSQVRGVAPDLVVRPFGWKGDVARLRRFVEEAARIHFGVQSQILAVGARERPDQARLGSGPDWTDPDGDGVVREIEEGTLTVGAVYLAMLEAPVILPPHDEPLRGRWVRGGALFDRLGCGGCHRRSLPLRDPVWREVSDTTGETVVLDLLRDGDEPRSKAEVQLFSDLARHDLGPGLADPHDHPDGIPRSVFLTRPLWGLADTGPYMHDGRAATIPEAILAHGGEAQAARDGFAALPAEQRRDVHVFLLSLTRTPKVRVAR